MNRSFKSEQHKARNKSDQRDFVIKFINKKRKISFFYNSLLCIFYTKMINQITFACHESKKFEPVNQDESKL